MKKYLFFSFTAIIIFILTLTGISCKTVATTTTAVEATTTTAAETTAAETTAEQAGIQPPKENVKIVLACWSLFEPMDVNWPIAYKMFKDKYPTIDIENKTLPYADHMTYLKTSLLGGEGPEIWTSNVGAQMAEFAAYAENLEPYAQADWGSNWKDMFYSPVLDWEYWANPDYLIGLPMGMSIVGPITYNKTLFDKLGLVPPKTYDELLQVAKTLKENGVNPWANAASEGWVNEHLFQIIGLQFGNGDEYDKAREGKITWTDPALVSTMEAFRKMFDDKLFGDDPYSGIMYPDFINAFYEGKYGMMHMGSWQLTTNWGKNLQGKQDPNTVFQVALAPDFGGNGQQTKATAYPGFAVSLNKDINQIKKDAAWIVIRELVNGVLQQFYLDKISTFGANKNIMANLTDLTEEQQKMVDLYNEYSKNVVYCTANRYQEIQTAVWDNLNEVAIGTKTPVEALEAIEAVSKTIKR